MKEIKKWRKTSNNSMKMLFLAGNFWNFEQKVLIFCKSLETMGPEIWPLGIRIPKFPLQICQIYEAKFNTFPNVELPQWYLSMK